jgi:exodeoxyribonuclease-3
MKIISYNVNGIRAAMKKGFVDWLKTHPADVICIQENKAQQSDVEAKVFNDLGYHDHWFCAQKKGYSGVTVFTKIKPDNIQCGTGHQVSDDEGRVIQLDFGKTRLINAYFPSGTTGDERQTYKYQWLDEIYIYLQEQRKNIRTSFSAAITILPIRRSISIIPQAIRKHQDSFRKKEPGWISSTATAGSMPSASSILSRIAIAGGASVFPA